MRKWIIHLMVWKGQPSEAEKERKADPPCLQAQEWNKGISNCGNSLFSGKIAALRQMQTE